MQFLSWWPKGSKVVCVFNSHILKIKPRYSTRLLHIYWKVTLWFSSIFPEKLSRERVTLWAFFRVLWASVDVGWDPRGPSTAGGHRQSTPWIRVIDHWDQQRGGWLHFQGSASSLNLCFWSLVPQKLYEKGFPDWMHWTIELLYIPRKFICS